MALPVTISGVAFSKQNYFCGPWIDGNGNVYSFNQDTTTAQLDRIIMSKATDPTDSFAEQDSAGRPDPTTDNADARTAWGVQDGDTIHIAGSWYFGVGGIHYTYNTFTTSDHGGTPDEWVVVDEVIEDPANGSAVGEVSISIVARSDGTVVVIYNGDEDSVMGNPFARVDYNIRSSGGTWGGPVTLVADDKAAVDWFGSVAVLGASDKTHFFYKDDANSDLKHTSLTSGDSLSSVQDIDTLVNNNAHVAVRGVYYDDGGTERIRVAYEDSSERLSLAQIDNDGTPGSVVAISDNDVRDINEAPVACLAVDDTTVHLLYGVDVASPSDDDDLFHDQADAPQDSGDWGTDTEFLDAVTINRISCNVIDRSGKKLAMVYDNAGTIQYNEKDIAVVSTTALPMMMQMNQFTGGMGL